MQEIKSVRVRRVDLSTDIPSAPVDYKVTLFGDGKKGYKVGVFQTGKSPLYTEYKKEGTFKKFTNDDFINNGVIVLISNNTNNKPTLKGGGSGMGQLFFDELENENILNSIDVVDKNIAYKIIQDPWLETPPPFRNFGFDPYHLNNNSTIIIRWLKEDISGKVLNTGGFKWSDDWGGELKTSKNNDNKKLIYKTAEVISPSGEKYFVNFQGSPFFSKKNDNILKFSGDMYDSVIITRVISMWVNNVFTKIYDRYNLSLCDPSSDTCGSLPYIDPIENSERLETPESSKQKEKLKNITFNVQKEGIFSNSKFGELRLLGESVVETNNAFDFGNGDDLSDLLLNDELKQVVRTEQSGSVMHSESFGKTTEYITAKYSIKIEKDNGGNEVYVGYISLNKGSAKIETNKGDVEIGTDPVEIFRDNNPDFIKVMIQYAKKTVESKVGRNLNWNSIDNINFFSSGRQ